MRLPALRRLALYLAFIAFGLFGFLHAPAEDLSSSYIGCRLIANGASAHLYDFDPVQFDVVDTKAWTGAAADGQFTGAPHPYVQTPLWAWALQPICANLEFGAFRTIFLCIALVSLMATVEIVARAWAGRFLEPVPLALLLVGIAVSIPFQYAMWLMQTHALFLMLTVLALYLAERGRAVVPGALLAVACAVKITPGLLLVHWLVGGRRSAALWFVVWSAVLAALTVAAVGIDVTLDYVQSMRRVSNVLLVSFNNQSLAAWLAYSDSLQSELMHWRMLPLPPVLKGISLIASLACVAVSGWMSRRQEWTGAAAALALIGITIFSPIAWTHYFLFLIPAVMVLTNTGAVLPLVVAAAVLALNLRPLATDAIALRMGSMTIIRSHFFSAVILMVFLVLGCAAASPNQDKPKKEF